MTDTHTLNVTRIRELMEQGFRFLKAPKGNREAVLVIGDTGVGKSTIISLLAGRKLVVKHNGLNTVIDSVDNSSPLKIGHDKFSQTSVPTKVVIGDLDFFDCSGFRDNRGDQFQISNSFFLQRLFFLYQKVKIFLIIDEHYISEARLDKLPKLIHSLGEAFGSLKSLQDGVVLLINKAKVNRDIKDYSKQLERLSHLKGDKPLFNDDQKCFLDYIISNNRIILYKQADESAAGKELPLTGDDLLVQIKKSSFIRSKKIKNIISQAAKLAIRDYADQLLKQGDSKFDELIQKIKNQLFKHTAVVTSSELEVTLSNIVKLLDNLKVEQDWNIAQVLKNLIPGFIESEFGRQISSVLFLRQIYEKSSSYFTVLKLKLISELTIYHSELQKHLAYLKQRQEELIQLKNKQIQLEKKLLAEAEQRNAFKKSAEQFETSFKKKKQDFQELSSQKNKQIAAAQELIHKHQTEYKQIIDKKQQQLISIKYQYEAKLKQSIQLVSNQQSEIKDLNNSFENNKLQINKIQEEKQLYAQQLQQLKMLFSDLKLNYQSKIQQIDQLSIQNQSLKCEIDNFENQSVADSTKSLASKTYKYPDVVCPHFKNGGKCKHCIKKWKESQSQLSNN